eukprot:15479542-Alexandrium_andersonii.AAC.1
MQVDPSVVDASVTHESEGLSKFAVQVRCFPPGVRRVHGRRAPGALRAHGQGGVSRDDGGLGSLGGDYL